MYTNIKSTIILFAAIIVTASCNRDMDTDKSPIVTFKVGGSYVSADTTLSKGDTIKICVNLSKAGTNDDLTKIVVYQSTSSTNVTTLYHEDLFGASKISYSKEFTIVAGNQAEYEYYTFTAYNKYKNNTQKEIVLTVK